MEVFGIVCDEVTDVKWHQLSFQKIFHDSAFLKRLFTFQVMVEDRSMHQTLAARQSRKMLRDMTRGLWDFMALLDLNEAEVDPIIDHMIQFVDFAQSNPKLVYRCGDESKVNSETYYKPVRQMDSDILWLKTTPVLCTSKSS